MQSTSPTTHDSLPQPEFLRRLEPSGIRPVDQRLGGIVPKRSHLLSGGPGAGKSISCLEFLHRGVENGESGLLITQDEPADVLASATFLGIDMEAAIRAEKIILLRYQPDFAKRLARAVTPDAAIAEMQRMVEPYRVGRVAIDSIAPLLDAGPISTGAIHSLAQFLDQMQVTSLIALSGDLSAMPGAQLEPLMQSAAAVFHLSSDTERKHTLEVRRIDFDSDSTRPVTFRVMPGAGMVVMRDAGAASSRIPSTSARTVLLVEMADAFPAGLLNSIRHNYDVDARTGGFGALADVVHDGIDALLLSVRRDVIDSALQLIRDLRGTNSTVPVVLVTPYILRSADRTRALRAGVDDFLSSGLAPAELLARLATIVQRGHWHDLVTPEPEDAMILQPMEEGGAYGMMSERNFEHSLITYLRRDRVPFFTLLLIRPEQWALDGVAQLVIEIVRVESGDLVGTMDDRVAAFLDSARPKDLASLKSRVREHALRRGFGDVEIEVLGFPAQEETIRELVSVSRSA